MTDQTNGATVVWRLGQLEQQVRDLDTGKAEARDLQTLADEMRAVRRALWGFAFSVLVAALTFALTVAQLQGP